MNRRELDALWTQAIEESIRNGEQVSRYHFAAVVAQAERERCALICEEVARLEVEQWALDGACAAHECAQRIRERGDV